MPLLPIPEKEEKMKIVVDTNVIVSALMNSNGVPARIITMILDKKLEVNFDNRIVFEYADVLSREEFGFTSEMIAKFIDHIKNNGSYVNSDSSKINFTDETDKKFYEVYKSAKAQYLITGNIKHFPNEPRIVTPRKFLDLIIT